VLLEERFLYTNNPLPECDGLIGVALVLSLVVDQHGKTNFPKVLPLIVWNLFYRSVYLSSALDNNNNKLICLDMTSTQRVKIYPNM